MKNRLWVSIILSILLIFTFSGAPVGAATTDGSTQTERVSIIVKGKKSEFKRIEEVDSSARLTRQFWIVDAIVAEVKSSKIDELKGKGIDFEIEQVFTPLKEERMKTANEAILQELRETTEEKGFDGRGTVIAVLDSGVDIKHKDLSADIESPKLTADKVKEKKLKGKYYNAKIPYAYNYADGDNDIKDTNVKSAGYGHGMHVIGIIGANGPANDKSRVRGVAPQAQIASMKIFYNNPRKGEGAPEGAVISAIEDAVSLDVDAMNLSFGVPAGIKDSSDLMQKAINAAKQRGILVVAAAGNAYYAGYPNEPTIDNSTISEPGVAEGAISVASFESELQRIHSFTFNGETIRYTKLNGDIKSASGVKLSDCGNGKAEDIKENPGVAIIYRSGVPFLEMIENVHKKGAKAVIIYNKDGDDSYVESIGVVEQDIPVIFVSNADGKKLLSNLGILPDFTDRMGEIKNPLSGMSAFSGYGPLNDLEIKPEITGIGGTVYSTVNDNSYATMGGTSMASPYVAGISLCYMNYLKDKNILFTPHDVTFAMMNTARILKNKEGLPFAVRRQGAGMIDFENMKKQEIRLAYDGKPKASLGEMGKEKEFLIKVKNTTSHKTTINLSHSDILTMDVSNAKEKVLEGADISFEPQKLTLDAGATAEVKVKLKVESVAENYVEGFIIANTDKTQANIPFLAYSGDFKNLSVFDRNFYEPKSKYKEQGLYSEYRVGGNKVLLVPVGGKNPTAENMGISPGNGDGMLTALPKLSFLRNAKDVKFYIEDDRHKMFTYIYATDYLRKEVTATQKEKSKISELWRWSGTYYDKKKGLKIPAPEGQYYYVVEASPVVEGAKKQVLRFPVKIDKTAPIVKSGTFITDTDVCEVTMTGEDRGLSRTDISHFVFVIDKDGYKEDDNTVFYLEKQNDEYRKILHLDGLENGIHKIYVGAIDYAGNMGTTDGTIISVKDSPVKLTVDKKEAELKEKIELKYGMPAAVRYRIYLNDTTKVLAETKETAYELIVPEAGKQTLIVEAVDEAGKSLGVNAVEIQVKEQEAKQDFEITSSHNIENNKITTTWDIINNYGQRKNVTVITCVYGKNNKLLNMTANTAYIEALSNDRVTNVLKIPKDAVKIKNYVWDDFEQLNTIMKEEVISLQKEDEGSGGNNEGSGTGGTSGNNGGGNTGNSGNIGGNIGGGGDNSIPVIPVFPVITENSNTDINKTNSEVKKPDETATVTEGETPLSVVNNSTNGKGKANVTKKKYELTKIKSKAVLAKIAAKYKKLFTKNVYKIKLFTIKAGKPTKQKIEIRIPYKGVVKGCKFYVVDIKSGKRYAARYDKMKKELVFKTDKAGKYAVLRVKVKKK
ncbi:MAG: S8 family serine peptidase [Lachnospiraceae bacterium]|nr:S8 family serine peptidase [Lachnospiraceae bacterium]